MAVLRSLDGKFYEVPDDQVEKYLVPADKVKEKLQAAGGPDAVGAPLGPPRGAPGGYAPIVVQIFGAAPIQGGSAPPPGQVGAEPGQAASEVTPYMYWNNYNWSNFHWFNH